ncbi:NAD-dependent protein deacetylase sirtuin-3, mitochondrial isoform X2 [Phascolarctos cinereus]|uniref:NAD-dependent protein deacetylase sirtuin-3, mitochondrial isoform X1 n=1 Tax=Phascolarctos cinereus TaxID=38626 RepID=A0A6P5JNH1_PHACI|nr:NAD-dependent protein deacetylase sirtuin-3, mitochondrial isoform X1 [Phascolarctos cinereus]
MGPGRTAAWTALGAALGPERGRPAAARGWRYLCLCRKPSVSGVWGSLRALHRSSSISLWEQVLPEKILRGEVVSVSSSWQRNFLGQKRDCLFAGVFSGCGAGGDHGGEKLSLQDIAELIRTKACQRVVVMVGAGISTPSGIPDFRSPGSGLYSNLEQYDLPYPEAIFELDYFFHNPKPFFTLAKELYPGNYRPNLAHYFLRLLHDKGLLLRLYTQNIDGLERAAGIPATKLVEAHGTFASATCTVCWQSFPGEEFQVDVMADRVPRCPICTGIIKPDVVFFGEQLPQRFFLHVADFPMADLLIIIGTSLEVEPFASLSQASRRSVPRVLINRELVGPFAWQPRHNDVAQLGDVISGVEMLVKALGWTKEIEDLVQRETNKDAL